MNDIGTDFENPDEETVVTAQDQPRRRPGRPRKETATDTAEAPAAEGRAAIETAEETAAPKNKAGRPRKVDPAESFAQQAKELHVFLAAFTGMPFMELSDKEAQRLGNAAATCAAEYGWENGGKIGAAITLVLALGAVEVPRLMAMRVVAQQRAGMAKAQADARANSEGKTGEGA